MNVLFLTHSFPVKKKPWGGVFIREQAKALSSVHNIIIAYFNVNTQQFSLFPSVSFTKKTEDKLLIYEISVKRSLPVLNQLIFLFGTYNFVRKEILANYKVDLIHSHLLYPAGFLGTIIQKRHKIPNIVTAHSKLKTYFRSPFHKLFVRYTLKNSKGVISVSNSLEKELYLFQKRPIFVIPNTVDTDSFSGIKRVRGSIVNIGFLGGLDSKIKGLDLLIKAMANLEVNTFFLHIGGNGLLLDYYRKLADENGILTRCRFFGDIKREDIVEFYSKLDIFILPSRYETFGVVLIEAMAAGIPVISTKCGGPEDIVNEMNGILIEKDNTLELEEAIKSMAYKLDQYDHYAISNYAKFNFGKDAFIEKINKAYRETLDGN